uniref:Uncharacterized protein n=1 Tax=Arundo donax TaxID=35708 RepID=A0A0A9FVQ3_ARUDO
MSSSSTPATVPLAWSASLSVFDNFSSDLGFSFTTLLSLKICFVLGRGSGSRWLSCFCLDFFFLMDKSGRSDFPVSDVLTTPSEKHISSPRKHLPDEDEPYFPMPGEIPISLCTFLRVSLAEESFLLIINSGG